MKAKMTSADREFCRMTSLFNIVTRADINANLAMQAARRNEWSQVERLFKYVMAAARRFDTVYKVQEAKRKLPGDITLLEDEITTAVKNAGEAMALMKRGAKHV